MGSGPEHAGCVPVSRWCGGCGGCGGIDTGGCGGIDTGGGGGIGSRGWCEQLALLP